MYTLIFSIEVTSSGDAGDRYTLIFSIKVTSFGVVLFGRFSICLNQWAGGKVIHKIQFSKCLFLPHEHLCQMCFR